jgi:hypothetical protein
MVKRAEEQGIISPEHTTLVCRLDCKYFLQCFVQMQLVSKVPRLELSASCLA